MIKADKAFSLEQYVKAARIIQKGLSERPK